MKIRKDFVTNSSSSNFIIETIMSVAPTAGVVFGALSSNMATLAEEAEAADINISGTSSDDSIILDGDAAIEWLIDNGFWDKDKDTFTEDYWTWYDQNPFDPNPTPLLGICGDYNAFDRENIEFTNIAIIVENPNQGSSGLDHDTADLDSESTDQVQNDTLEEKDEALEEQDTSEDTNSETTEDFKDQETEESSETTDEIEDQTAEDSQELDPDDSNEHNEETPKQEAESDQTQDSPPSGSRLVEAMNDKLDEFLTDKEKTLLEGQNVTVHLEVQGDSAETIEISVVDGETNISSGKSKDANITITFNESLLENLKKLNPKDKSKKKPTIAEILDIQVQSDKKHNKLAMDLVRSKLNQFVEEKKIDKVTAKLAETTLNTHLTLESFGRVTSLISNFFK